MLQVFFRGLLLKVLLTVLFLAVIFAAWQNRFGLEKIFSSPEVLKNWVEEWGAAAPIVFIGLQFFQVVVFLIPGEIPQVAGGFLFGLVWGTIYSSVGILLGATFNFFLAKTFGRPLVVGLFGAEGVLKFETFFLSDKARTAFFLLFVIPGIPKDFLCYVAGLGNMGYGSFMVISFLGRLPGIFGSSYIGHAAASRKWLQAGIVLVGATVVFILGTIFRAKIQERLNRIIGKKDDVSRPGPQRPGEV